MSDAQATTLSKASPEVSVIIPAYNSAAFISVALDSVLAQTFDRFEIIVINDGSADTVELEHELERYSQSVRYITQENLGAAAARNAGLRIARGELVAFLDADDSYLPTFLARQIALLRSSGADLVHSDAYVFGDPRLAGQTFMGLQGASGEATPERLLSIQTSVLTSAVVARKAPILDVGCFDESLRRGQDFDLWFRLSKAGCRFAYQPESLVNHKIDDSGLSGGTISKLQRTVNILELIRERGGLTLRETEALQATVNRTKRDLTLERGKERLLKRDFAGARYDFDEARKLRSGWKLALVSFGLRVAPEMIWRAFQRREMAWQQRDRVPRVSSALPSAPDPRGASSSAHPS
jgi:glycosyltransferase involved in cell wall biosynthesis